MVLSTGPLDWESLKNLLKIVFWANLHKGVIMGHAKNGKQFLLVKITKANHQPPETFYFIKISYLFLSLVMFFVKKVSFPAKTIVTRCIIEKENDLSTFSISFFFGSHFWICLLKGDHF